MKPITYNEVIDVMFGERKVGERFNDAFKRCLPHFQPFIEPYINNHQEVLTDSIETAIAEYNRSIRLNKIKPMLDE